MPRHYAIPYLVACGTLCLIAISMITSRPAAYALTTRAWVRFLLEPWKVLTFLVAAGFFVLVAPYTGDPTWDRVDGGMMSVLTYLTAPWAVGVLYRAARGWLPWHQVFVALCLWMLSASWCYDGYLFFRDGVHPSTWASNILASSLLYASAGLLWNLVWQTGRGVIFGFMAETWPPLESSKGQSRVLVYGLLFILLVVAMMVPFVWEYRHLLGIR